MSVRSSKSCAQLARSKNKMENLRTFEERLIRNGRLVYTTRGYSMRPMLHQGRDLVVIEPREGRLRKYDVALYKRDGKYVLHRVIAVNAQGYTARGDSNFFKEPGIRDEDILGVLTSFTRGGKQHKTDEFGYKLYSRLWNAVYPLRACVHSLKKGIRRAAAFFRRKRLAR